MDHLTYQETTNRSFRTYQSKFKKMVKEDLSGDGWFLLVKDFPFKDGDNLMFTAGEDIGKWIGKSLASLYGKTNYIIGRCRKRGPVFTLLDIQEGGYIREATESGVREELKELFKGTGLSVRIFKSLKVEEEEPERSDEELTQEESPVIKEEKAAQKRKKKASTKEEIKKLEMPEMRPSSIRKTLHNALATAKRLGVDDKPEFLELMTRFQKSIPRGSVMMKISLQKLNLYFEKNKLGSLSDKSASEAFIPDMQAQIDALEKQKENLQKEFDRLQKRIGENLEFLESSSDVETLDLENLEHQLLLAEENEKYLVRMEEIKKELRKNHAQLAERRSAAKA